MLTAFLNAFRTPDLRKKILFVLGLIAVFRLCSVVPAPGVNLGAVRACLREAQTGDSKTLYSLVNLLSGGALLQLTIFALGVMPYITASIILQLLTVVIPRLEKLKKEGQAGQSKITQYTRYLTLALGVMQATAFVAYARSGQLFQGCNRPLLFKDDWFVVVVMVLTMTAGCGLVMWMGELITERGIGNGMSILIFTQVGSQFPTSLWTINKSNGTVTFIGTIVVGLMITAAVVFVEQAQRRIPVQYAKRMVGRREYGGSSTYIPLKVNQASVIPVIFASSLLYLPVLVSQFNQESTWAQWIGQRFVSGNHPIYMITYATLIIFFTFFYVSITFNPKEVADNMKNYGGFIPGVRAGKPTENYLAYVLNRITTPGSLYLALIAMVPLVALVLVGANQNFPFGGATLLILVGVGLDTVKQIESQLQQRNYEGFLR